MTFREKYKLDHPENDASNVENSVWCPYDFRYEDGPPCTGVDGYGCAECWDREMPGTENDISKGEKEMVETRKTKKELLEEIAELKKEIERVDQRKQFDDSASALKMQYDALVDAGFDPDRAFGLLMTMIQAAGGNR